MDLELFFELSGQVIHIWMIDVTNAEQYLDYCNCLLSADEQKRANRFYFAHLRKAFVLSRALLRILTAAYLKTEPHRLRFVYGPQGKPSLDRQDSLLQFNLSHAGSLVVYGFAVGCSLGLDIENIRDLSDKNNIARRLFSPGECHDLGMAPEELRSAAFFRCWTRKEAFVKAVGKGLSYPLEAFQVSTDIEDPHVIQINGDQAEASQWSLHELSLPPGYTGAMAYRAEKRQVVYSASSPLFVLQEFQKQKPLL